MYRRWDGQWSACSCSHSRCSYLMGWVEMLAFALVCATLLVSSAVLSVGNTTFSATLSVSNTRVSVNQTMHAMVTVSNPSTSVTASASGDLPISQSSYERRDERHHERFAIPSLGSHQSKQTAIPLTATHRSVVTVGPLSVRKGDPFGLKAARVSSHRADPRVHSPGHRAAAHTARRHHT